MTSSALSLRGCSRARWLAPALWLLGGAAGAQAAGDLVEQFQKEVLPVLEASCFKCHGAEKQKGALRLDRKQDMMGGGDSGEPAITPGKSVESPLVARITTAKPDEMMPPKGDRLTPQQIAAIQRWIDNGAHWPASEKPEPEPVALATATGKQITDDDRKFWSFQPPQRSQPALPQPTTWPRQPLDFFIAARLAENKLAPAPEAAPTVFIRRLTLDLTGLPPTPEEVDAFLEKLSCGFFIDCKNHVTETSRPPNEFPG